MQQCGLEIVSLILFIIVAVLAGLIFKTKRNKSAEIAAARADALLQEKDRRIEELNAANAALQKEKDALAADNVRLRSDSENQKKYLEERLDDLMKNKEELLQRFQNISGEVKIANGGVRGRTKKIHGRVAVAV